MDFKNTKTILTIIVSIIIIIGAIITINNSVAKTDDIIDLREESKLVQERLDISIADDHIHYQEQTVDRIKSLTKFEMRKGPLTEVEKEVIQIEEKKLEKLRTRREQKAKEYRGRRK